MKEENSVGPRSELINDDPVNPPTALSKLNVTAYQSMQFSAFAGTELSKILLGERLVPNQRLECRVQRLERRNARNYHPVAGYFGTRSEDCVQCSVRDRQAMV